MPFKLKLFGQLLAAALAMVALAASAAQAEFHSAAEHTIIDGSQTTSMTWTMGSGFGAVSCSSYTLKGTASSKTEGSWTLEENRGGCKDSLGRTVDIEGNLKYTFTTNTNAGGTSDAHVSGSIVQRYTNGSGIAVCTVSVFAQTNSGVTYKSLGGTGGVEITFHVNNTQSTIEGGFFNCGTTTTTATAGTQTGTMVLNGKNTAGQLVELRAEVE